MKIVDTAFKAFKKPKKKTSQEMLNDIRIAAPCTVSWESMSGDDQVRFCGSCEKNVFDLSTLSADAAVDLIREKQGRVCIQIYRRRDGTVLTGDCPKGLQRLRQGIAKRVACVAAALGFLGLAGIAGANAQSAPSPTGEQCFRPSRGEIAVETATDIVDPTSQVVVVKAENTCDRTNRVVRVFLAVAAIGAAIWSIKHLKRKPVWVTAVAIVSICCIFGFLWK